MRCTIVTLTTILACTPVSTDPAGTGTTGTGTTFEDPTSTGFICEGVGLPCDLDAPACAAGLDCVEINDAPGTGVCAQECNLQDGVNAAPCAIGFCDALFDGWGMCRDGDGLPIGLCDGVPACAGDPCESACDNGLSCIAGACAFACEVAADCAPGQACLAGACFDSDGLADPCN